MELDIEIDPQEDDEPNRERPDYEMSDNAIQELVTYSRSKQVLNEPQTVLTMLVYTTGFFRNSADYGALKLRGGSGGGKTHLKENVIENLFEYRMNLLYKTTSTSAKAIIDDPEWDQTRIAALDEMNKIPEEMMELLKSTYGDDGGFSYKRNLQDSSSETGFSPTNISREPKPVIFMLADENNMSVEKELETRFMDVKVDENEEKNEGVHDMKWGHESITLPSTSAKYGEPVPEIEEALKWHIREMPLDVDAVLPTGEGRFEGDDWDAAAVARPLFNFKTSASVRASRMVASLVKASAVYNYHSRPTTEIDGEEYYIVQPQDLVNVLMCREILLNMTHSLDEKKFAILDAIIEKGGSHNKEGTKLQTTKKKIEEYLHEKADISSITKSELNSLLNEMDEKYIIDITENPEDRRENLYVYGGADAIGEPNIWDYYDHFKDCTDVILNQPIEKTIEEQQKRLGKSNPKELLANEKYANQGSSKGQKTLSGGTTDLNDLQVHILTKMHEALDGKTVAVDDIDGLDYEHMLGVSPVEETEEGTVQAVSKPQTSDIPNTVFDPASDWWDGLNRGEVKAEVSDAVATLKQKGYWDMKQDGDVVEVTVTAP